MMQNIEKTAAANLSLITADFGDKHQALTASKNYSGPAAEELRSILAKIRIDSGAAYVYTMIKKSVKEAVLVIDSADPAESGDIYEMEPPMGKAFNGKLSADEGIWEDEKEAVLKSVYCPVKNSKNKVIAILGFDFKLEPELEAANRKVTKALLEECVKTEAQLKGNSSDMHEELVKKGGRNTASYPVLQKELIRILRETKAKYVYTMIKTDESTVIIIADAAMGSAADPYGTKYPLEPYMKKALAGTAAADPGIWFDTWSGQMLKSAAVPLINSKSIQVGLLGIDIPVDFNKAPFIK
jgi:hypothetical protein